MPRRSAIHALGLVPLALALLLLSALPALAAPANDERSGALPLSVPGSVTAYTGDATTNPTDPRNACAWMGSTVWYAITPTSRGTVTVNTIGSDSGYDTVVAVYQVRGQRLTEVACNDDAAVDPNNPVASQVSFNAGARKAYYIMAGAFGGDFGGNLVLNDS